MTQREAAARPRRTTLTVPGANRKMQEKARALPADEVLLDLEDAVAPEAKADAREVVVSCLNEGWYDTKIRAVRVNDWSTDLTLLDLTQVVVEAGRHIDCIVLPKVDSPEHVTALDLVLTQLEKRARLDVGGIGIEAQLESAAGVGAARVIARASARLESLVFGPLDFMASLGMSSLDPNRWHRDPDISGAYHHALMQVLLAARAHGLQAIDGPFVDLQSPDGLGASAARSAKLGLDGKWVVHPSQIDPVNDAFTPSQDEYDAAERVIDACDFYASAAGGGRGAFRLDGQMIDEASRKVAERVTARGRRAGLPRTTTFTPPGG